MRELIIQVGRRDRNCDVFEKAKGALVIGLRVTPVRLEHGAVGEAGRQGDWELAEGNRAPVSGPCIDVYERKRHASRPEKERQAAHVHQEDQYEYHHCL